MILNTPFIADWEAIRLRRKKTKDKTNQLGNKNRKPHTYIIQRTVSMRHKKNTSEDLYVRPYTITYVYTNGNTTIIRGAVQ